QQLVLRGNLLIGQHELGLVLLQLGIAKECISIVRGVEDDGTEQLRGERRNDREEENGEQEQRPKCRVPKDPAYERLADALVYGQWVMVTMTFNHGELLGCRGTRGGRDRSRGKS